MDTNEPPREVEEQVGRQAQRDLGSVFGMILVFAVIGGLMAIMMAFVPRPYTALFLGLSTLLGLAAAAMYFRRPRLRG